MEPGKDVDRVATAVIGAAIEVHRHLGAGFVERVYEDALVIELGILGIPFRQQMEAAVVYKGERVGSHRLDLLVADKVIVELKTVESILPVHKAQLISYLNATGKTLGLLINFNVPLLRNGIQRVVLT